MDKTFAVVAIDPAQGLYAVQVGPEKLPTKTESSNYQGPWSSPQISPFGPGRNGDTIDLTGGMAIREIATKHVRWHADQHFHL